MLTMKDLKKAAISIFLNALKATDIGSLIRQKVQVSGDELYFDDEKISLSQFDEVLLIGFGKASLEMGSEIEAIFQDKIQRGILVSNRQNNRQFKSEVILAGHPTPTQNSLLAGKKIVEALNDCSENTLSIFLISGGGSSLVEWPVENLTLEDIQELNQVLIKSGATIKEINMIRKGFSQLKGGKLRHLVKGAKSLAIYLSDVNQGDLRSLASGPLFAESFHPQIFADIVKKYQLLEALSPNLCAAIHSMSAQRPTNPSDDIQLTEIRHLLLLENADLLEIAARLAGAEGFKVEICKNIVEGKYQEVAEKLFERVQNLAESFPDEEICILSGGEVECAVKANGIGGRNQEFVLYFANKLSEWNQDLEIAVLSSGTDGVDGVSCAAGAVLSSADFYKSNKIFLNASSYIHQNDSHSFFKQSGGLLVLGPTGNNVRDLRIVLARKKNLTIKESEND
jgi:glycerate-2-kinase